MNHSLRIYENNGPRGEPGEHNCEYCNKWDTGLSFLTINGWTAHWHTSCASAAKREADQLYGAL